VNAARARYIRAGLARWPVLLRFAFFWPLVPPREQSERAAPEFRYAGHHGAALRGPV